MSGPVLTHLQHVTTVTNQVETSEGQTSLTPEVRNGSTPARQQDFAGSRVASTTYLYSSSSRPHSYSGPLGFLRRKDARAEVFVESFMFWLDTVEMVRVAGEPSVFYSAWVFPVYILALVSTLRMAIAPNSSLLSSAGFALQDLPFFILRVALIAVFGFVSPLLYPLKNALVSLTFIYFTFLANLRIFRGHSMFWGVEHSVVERSTVIVDGWAVGMVMWGKGCSARELMTKNMFWIVNRFFKKSILDLNQVGVYRKSKVIILWNIFIDTDDTAMCTTTFIFSIAFIN